MNARDNRSITSTRLKSRVGRIHKSLTSYGTILFVLFIAFSSTGLYFLKNTTMSNTRATITEMSTRVGTKAIAALDHQQQFLETAAHYLADKQQDAKLTGRNIDYLTWLKDCYSLLSRNFGTAHFELHVYVDGVLYTTASRAQGGILPFDGRDALWYQRALQNHGRTVLIDPYTDLFTGTRIITLAARVGNTQNVLACDLFPELSRITELDNLLPQGFSFYLTDSHGYIAAYTAHGTSYREAQETVNTYFLPLFNDPETFAARSIVFVDAEEEDLLAVLIRDPVTGWFTVLTTSYENMLRGYYAVEELFIFMIVAFLVIGLGMLIREHHLSRQIEVNHETLKVLGNSYQTIVRINFNRGTYTLLKGSDLLRERLKKLPESKRHKYSSLMQVICSIISPEFRESFEENYGLSSVAHFAINRVRDVGHDYRFETAEGTHLWYNVRILFDESLDLEESVLSFKLVDDEKLQELTEQSLLRDALESARRSESSKNAFFASVSHDMRTPLNGIIGLCTLVFAHKESELKIPDLLASFRKIDSSSRQLLQLVDDVLEVSRPTETRAPARERFNLHTSLNEVLEIFESNYLNLPGDISVTDFEFTRENDVVKIDITFLKDGEETELEAQGNGSLSAINDALRTYTGREYSLERNEGENNLHSGTACFGRKLWSVIGVSENGCTLGLATPALAGGFPGAHEAMVSYTLSDKGVLTLDYTVSSDEKCPVSVTNHAYFNLNGRKSTVMNHILALDSEGYLEVDAGKIPVAVVPVDGTDFDFRTPQLVGSRRGGDYDHCFTLPPEPHIHAEGDAASMDVLTTEPGIQIYTGGGLKQDHGRFEGICFETGRYPDTPNHPDFPQAFSEKGKPYRTTTSFVLKPKR